jgi:hypothetical protein
MRERMSAYKTVDDQIRQWAEMHSLRLLTSWAERDVHCVYISSARGECFQIWGEPPVDGDVCVGVSCVAGRYELDPDTKWIVTVSELDVTLERALHTAKELMSRP